MGIKDTYDKGGEYNFLKEKHGLSSEKIVNDILQKIKLSKWVTIKSYKKFF